MKPCTVATCACLLGLLSATARADREPSMPPEVKEMNACYTVGRMLGGYPWLWKPCDEKAGLPYFVDLLDGTVSRVDPAAR